MLAEGEGFAALLACPSGSVGVCCFVAVPYCRSAFRVVPRSCRAYENQSRAEIDLYARSAGPSGTFGNLVGNLVGKLRVLRVCDCGLAIPAAAAVEAVEAGWNQKGRKPPLAVAWLVGFA